MNRFPAFGLDLLSGARAAIIVGRHLGQNSIAQAQRRIAKAFQAQALQQFVIDSGSGDDDLGPPRSDAFRSCGVRPPVAAPAASRCGSFPRANNHSLAVPSPLQWLATAASAAAVPELRSHSLTFAVPIRVHDRLTSRVTKPRRRLSSPFRAGSWRRNSLVGEPLPAEGSRRRECVPVRHVSSQLPPPRSIISVGRGPRANPKRVLGE